MCELFNIEITLPVSSSTYISENPPRYARIIVFYSSWNLYILTSLFIIINLKDLRNFPQYSNIPSTSSFWYSLDWSLRDSFHYLSHSCQTLYTNWSPRSLTFSISQLSVFPFIHSPLATLLRFPTPAEPKIFLCDYLCSE